MVTENGKQPSPDGEQQTPVAFLSYAGEDKDLAKQVANTLQENGIETWWDEWEIRHGDSIRQKVDEGIGSCTHFLVLLTPQSIDKPWVKAEMDSAFVRKLKGKCRFNPVRHKLTVEELPPTLQSLHSPEIESGTNIDKLISDIYEMNKKPSRGKPPAAVLKAQEAETGYSPAVSAVARVFVEKSKNSRSRIMFVLSVGEIIRETGLSSEDVEDAYHELEDYGFLKGEEYIGWSVSNPSDSIAADLSLFAEFDRFYAGWDTKEDTKRIAIDMSSDKNFPTKPADIAKRYEWEMSRLEPALHWLREQEIVKIHNAIGEGIGFCVEPNRSALRRFVREIS